MWTSEEKDVKEVKGKNMSTHGLAWVTEYNFVSQIITEYL